MNIKHLYKINLTSYGENFKLKSSAFITGLHETAESATLEALLFLKSNKISIPYLESKKATEFECSVGKYFSKDNKFAISYMLVPYVAATKVRKTKTNKKGK